MAKREKLVLFDGNAIFHRAYHAIPHLTNREGLATNAVYGFANMLLKILGELKPDYAIVAWDKSSKTFRKRMYADYKANRAKQPDDLYAQIPLARELVEAMNMPLLELDDFEADDIIGTLATQANGQDVIIVTGDLDELQLVDGHIKVYAMQKGVSDTKVYDRAAMHERYGLTPEQFVDFKALKGDASDNIPGVSGIGEKTASDLIQRYGSLDGVYDHIGEIKGKLSERLREQKDQAYLSQELSRIVRDAPVKLELEKARLHDYDRQKVFELFRRLDFKSLLSKLPAQPTPSYGDGLTLFDEPVAPRVHSHLEHVEYTCVQTREQLDELVGELKKQDVFAFDTETDSLDVISANLVGLGISFKGRTAYYIPVGHAAGDQLSTDEVVTALKPALEDPKIGKVGHNIKFDYEIMRRYGVCVGPVAMDTMIAGFVLNPLARAQTLSDMAYAELGIEMVDIEELIGKRGPNQATFDSVTIEDATRYAGEDADITWRLYQELSPRIERQGYSRLVEEIEWPLIPVLAEMEIAGVQLDAAFLKELNRSLSKRILELEERICKLAGEKFNISSPAQLSRILFDKLGLVAPGVRRGKTGLSTAARELEKMRGTHPIIDEITEYRELVKLKTTYIDALPKLVHPSDGRVHTSFSQTVAQTGRLSSSNPNLQNIPIRTELGREIRKAFVAPGGRMFVAADYSQIELRVAAALSKDEKMIQTFKEGLDLHAQTAAELYGVPLDKVEKGMREAAKTINFGVLYGMSAHGLSQATGMNREEAAAFIKRYFEVRPKLAEYIEGLKQQAREQEYTETLFGRRRPCPEINSNNFQVSQAAERYAVNVPIQGTAADIMKLAMIKLAAKFDRSTKMLLQIHDELIVETDEKLAKVAEKLMRETMEGVYDLGVPLAVETAIGRDWGELG